jgi:DNA-directed RNA polymerase specialized sigma24 family protein
MKWRHSPEALARLLAWLDPDPDFAALQYDAVHERLTRLFRVWGLTDSDGPEEQADETLDRLARALDNATELRINSRMAYLRTIARHVLDEVLERRLAREVNSPANPGPDGVPLPSGSGSAGEAGDLSALEECQERCLARLDNDDRKLVLDYYAITPQDKIRRHQEMASARGLTVNALRIRVFRLRQRLRACVLECQEQHRRGM